MKTIYAAVIAEESSVTFFHVHQEAFDFYSEKSGIKGVYSVVVSNDLVPDGRFEGVNVSADLFRNEDSVLQDLLKAVLGKKEPLTVLGLQEKMELQVEQWENQNMNQNR